MFDLEYIKETYENTYDKYYAVRKLAREYKVKPADIFKVLKDNGIIGKGVKEEPRKNRYTPEEVDMLLAMKAEGKTYTEIGQVLGRSEKTLSAKYNNLIKEGYTVKKAPKQKSKEQPAPVTKVQVEPEHTEEEEPVVAVAVSESRGKIRLESIPEGYTLKARITVWFPYLDAVEEFLNESEFAKNGGLDQVQIEEKHRIILKNAEEDA